MKFKQFKIANLINREIGAEEEYDIDEPVRDMQKDDPAIVRNIICSLTLLKAKDRIEANFLNLRTEVVQPCPLCTTPIRQKIEIPFFSYTYIMYPEGLSAEELADSFFVDMKNNIIDISDALREEIIVHTDPFIPCKKNCLGICPMCGKDRNKESCKCVTEQNQENDKPLKGLKILLKKSTGRKSASQKLKGKK